MASASIVVFIFAVLTFATANTPNQTAGPESSADGLQDKAAQEVEINKFNSSSETSENMTKTVPKKLIEARPKEPIVKDDTPLKGECSMHRDCPYNHCCTVGMMRFTFPSCAPMGNIDDPCMPTAEPRNFTLTYPNLKFIKVKEAYLLFCPCGSGLVCDRNSNTCQLPSNDNLHAEPGHANELAEEN